jgi:hypothetical protein
VTRIFKMLRRTHSLQELLFAIYLNRPNSLITIGTKPLSTDKIIITKLNKAKYLYVTASLIIP